MSGNGEITINDILAMDDGHVEEVPVPQWNDAKLTVASMTAKERSEIERRWSDKDAKKDPGAFRQDVLVQTLKKKDGSPFGSPEQIGALMGKNAGAVEIIFEAACRINGLTKKDVEELEGN